MRNITASLAAKYIKADTMVGTITKENWKEKWDTLYAQALKAIGEEPDPADFE